MENAQERNYINSGLPLLFGPVHPAVGFINTLFKPSDCICIGLLNEVEGWQQFFCTAAEIVTNEKLNILTAKNHHSSIYVSMNTFNAGLDKRTKANIAAIRNVYLDIDHDGPANRDKVLRSSLVPPPTFVLESSPNKFQFMWSLEEEMPIEEHERLLQALARDFGGDIRCAESARVLRLPGFVNRKPEYLSEPTVSINFQSKRKCRRDDFKVTLAAPVVKETYTNRTTVYSLIFDELGWEPFSKLIGEEMEEGAPHNCPFHEHHEPGNFGIIAERPWQLHCLGTGHGDRNDHIGETQDGASRRTFDLVQAVYCFEGLPETMRECAGRICVEYGLDFDALEEQARQAGFEEECKEGSQMAEQFHNAVEYGQQKPLNDSSSSNSSIPPIEPIAVGTTAKGSENEMSFPDMSEEAVGDSRLAEICRNKMGNFARAYSFPALLTAAGVMVPLQTSSGSIIGARQTNLYTALIGPVGSGKSQAIEQAAAQLSLTSKNYSELKAGSMEGLLARLAKTHGALETESTPQILVNLDEFAFLFKKAGIENASYVDHLNSGFYKSRFEVTAARQSSIQLNCVLSLIGGIVSDRVEECFGASSTSGLHDRFLFGVCPTNNPFRYVPFDVMESANLEKRLNPCAVSVDPAVWELMEEWKRADSTLGRSAEVTLRCAVIIAAFDGRTRLFAKDVEAMRPFLNYQVECRKVILPNAGTTLDAKMCNAIMNYLRRKALSGEWVTGRSLRRGLQRHIDNLGPFIFLNAIKNLQQVRAIEKSTHKNEGARDSEVFRLLKTSDPDSIS